MGRAKDERNGRPKKNFSSLEELSVKYLVYKLCKISKVSRSGYYKWKNRKKLLSDKKVQDLQIKEVLLEAAHNIKQSMSHKGNCWDNAPIESFLSHSKSELPHFLTEETSIEPLKEGISRYIKFYNRERIQLKLKGLFPVFYRTQAS